jgi:hypothetical protein
MRLGLGGQLSGDKRAAAAGQQDAVASNAEAEIAALRAGLTGG